MKNNNNFHLVLVGHANEFVSHLAGLDTKTITSICENNPSIQHIHLLGCNVAKARQPEKEKKMVENIISKSKLKYGLASILEAASDGLQEKCCVFCEKNNLDGMYVLNKKTIGNYQLFSMKYDKDQKTIQEKIKVKDLSINRFQKGITGILHNQKKPISFPRIEKNALSPIRNKENPLTLKELASVRGLAEGTIATRFEKAHPKYKKDKSRYPFLAKIEADPTDLRPSLLKKWVDAIKANKNITWNITIQGPTKAFHVDTVNRNFKVTRTHLYHEYEYSFFKSKNENINRLKLDEERNKELEDMVSTGKENEEKESKAAMLAVTIKKYKLVNKNNSF